MEQMTAEQFLADSWPNVIERLENLEEQGKHVHDFLFTGTEERPSFQEIALKIDRHVDVLCDWANLLGKIIKGVFFALKWLGITAGALGAVYGLLHTFGLAYAQAGINETGTFGDYLSTLLHSKRLVQVAVLGAFGLAGIAANYTWKWLSDQITGSLWRYLALDHPKRTLASLAAYAGWMFGVAFPSEMVTDASAWTAVINLALTTGFAIDVVANKATRASWTPEQRAAKNVE